MASSPGYPIKLSYDGETRKFLLKENGDEYEQLISHARNMFSSLSDTTIKITYRDEDGDCITISSLEEFQLALLHSQATKFEVDAKPLSTASPTATSTSTKNQINDAIHNSITCDECGMYPIIGDRFKCSLRRDFDLCSACERKTVQPYPMLKIYNSQQSPASFVVTLHDGQFLNEQVDGEIFMSDDEASVDATPVSPIVAAHAPVSGGGGRGCGQQGRRWFKCGGRGGYRQNFHPHDKSIPPHGPPFHHGPPRAPGGPHGPPFHRGPPTGRGRGWRGPFNQPFSFPFPGPFGRHCQQGSSTHNSGSNEASASDVTPEEMKENLANVVSSVFTGVANMMNSNLKEESQSTESEFRNQGADSNPGAAKQAAANIVSSIFTNVANLAGEAVRNSSPSGAPSTGSRCPPQYVSPKAILVEDVTFPPHSTVPAGASFVKVWKVRNVGGEPWPKDLRLEVCGTDNIFSNAFKDLGELSVAPGESIDISITLIAPAEIGTYVEYFTLRNGISTIGPHLCVDLQVIEGGEMGDWNVVTSTSHDCETGSEKDRGNDENNSSFGTWKLHMMDLEGHVNFYDTNGDIIFQLAFDNDLMTMNSCVHSEWGGAEFVPIDPKQLPLEAKVNVTEEGFEVSFEGPKRYVFRDGKHHLEAGENIIYMYKHRIPIRFFRGEVTTSGDTYNVIRVSSQKEQPISEPAFNESASVKNAEMQEEMYSRYALEIEHLADMGFTNYAVSFPILKAVIPIPASESETGKVDVELINEVVAMLVARTS